KSFAYLNAKIVKMNNAIVMIHEKNNVPYINAFSNCVYLPSSGCSKSHQMISFGSRRQLVFPLLIGKAKAPCSVGTKAKDATSCLRRLHNQHRVGQSLR